MSLEAVVDAEVVRSAEEWAGVIKADLSSAVEGIVAAGQHLIAAKADVQHGQWLPMLKAIGISEAESRRLQAIGRQFSNRPSLDDLPRSVSALYELSRLPADEIEAGIESGAITPDMTIRHAREFARPEPVTTTPEPTVAQCIHCGDTLPLAQLYEGGQGYECDPCVSGDEPEAPTDTCRGCDGHGCETCFAADAAEDPDADWGACEVSDSTVYDCCHGIGAHTLQCRTVTALTDAVTEPQAIPEPEPKSGADPEPVVPERKQRKHPLPDSFWRATFDLKKRAESVVRLAADDRFKKNKDQIADVNLSDLIRVRDALTGVIQQLEG